MMLDYLIRKATVFDGEQIAPRQVDVGVAGDTIAHVGEPLTRSAAHRVIEAQGRFLCPGFIDTHASTGLGYMMPHAGDNKLYQGVTTEIIGNCGTSTAPIGELLVPTMERLAAQIGFTFNWRTLGEWFARVENHGLPFNSGTFVGHSTLRGGTCRDAQQVTRREIDQMIALLDQAMQEGALGLSTGLVYAPGSFATTGEIIELARVASQYGGIYVSHIRDERQDLEASIEEAIEIGRQAELPVLVSHLKAAERPNWGKIPRVIAMIEEARRRGVRITFEVYPYAAVSTKLRTFIPKAIMSNGVEGMVERLRTEEWRRRSVEWLEQRGTDYAAMVLITESLPHSRGRSIQEVAEMRQQHPAQAVVDVLLADPDAWIVYHCMAQEDVDAAVLWPHSIICSDSWSYPVNAPRQIGDPHPRTYGAFTRFLERYALREERLPFGEAIRKITALPADWLGLPRRGRIARGNFADLVLLDPARVREKATFDNPRRFSEGTEYVWVNGTLMLEQGELQEHLPGRILRRNGKQGGHP
ncbi:MAG: D-aminoacylase [Calditrichaeota bacterium]|nr:MAG: D-aminoacylase [Calditrichota bacterium]